MLPCTELQTFLFENISQSFLIVGICALFIKLGRFFLYCEKCNWYSLPYKIQ